MISSTDARKFLGPTLFGKKEHTAELPEAAGKFYLLLFNRGLCFGNAQMSTFF